MKIVGLNKNGKKYVKTKLKKLSELFNKAQIYYINEDYKEIESHLAKVKTKKQLKKFKHTVPSLFTYSKKDEYIKFKKKHLKLSKD